MKKYRVLMIGPDRSVHGGISGVVNNYYEAGLNEKIDLFYIGTMVEGSKVRKLLQAAAAYIRFLKKLPRYDIVHVNMAADASYYRKAVFIKTARFAKKKIIIHQHGGDFETFYYKKLGEWQRKKVQKVLSMGDAFLVLAPVWKEFFGRIIEENKITILPDSIKIPASCEKKYGSHKLLFLGRLCKAKGIVELIAAMSVLKEKYPDIHLYLGGIWEDKDLKQLAEERQDCITYLSWICGEEKKKYLEECDIFVLPSYFEGQSVSILEAMAYSCAVVASKTGGIPQMILDGETGILVEPQSELSLQEGLEKVLSDSSLAEKLGRKARDKVSAEYAMENNIERLLSIYQSVSEG
jgi:glycosyltransferase involved in cell wall biosynthesis